MKAAVLREYGSPMSVEDVELLEPGPRDVVVQVAASGVCHTDMNLAAGYVPLPVPMILGHEGCGQVVEVGAAVASMRPGDRVIAAFSASCGQCWFCVRSQTHLCERTLEVAFAPKGELGDGLSVSAASGLGTFAEHMVVDETMLVKVDSDLPSEQLALIGCGVTTGVGAALNTARVLPGSSVAVFGCGGVGQSVIQGARIAGAARIFAVDPVPFKRETALMLGATDAVDAAADPLAAILSGTSGRGVDFAFEVVGASKVLNQAFQAARRGGVVVAVGMPAQDATVTLSNFELFWDEKHLMGCNYGSAQVRRDFPRFISLAEAGRLDLGALVSERMRLEDVNRAFANFEKESSIRSVLTFQ